MLPLGRVAVLPKILSWHSILGQRRVSSQNDSIKYQNYTIGTDLSIFDSMQAKKREFQAEKLIQPGKTVLVSVPFCYGVTFGCAEKYCAHCHLSISKRSFQSLFNYDFYEFASCRDYFDSWKSELYKELRADFRSRFNSNNHKFRVRAGVQLDVSAEDFSYIKGLVMIIARKTAEEESNSFSVPMVSRTEDNCIPSPEMSGPEVYNPTFADFTDLPTGEESIPSDRRLFYKQLAKSVDDILHQRDTYKNVRHQNLGIYDSLCRMHTHSRRIIRQDGSYGAAVDTGFGVYPSARYLQFSNIPNCEHYYDLNCRLVLRSVREIYPGDGITISSFPMLLEEVDAGIGSCMKKSGSAERVKKMEEAEGDVNEKFILLKRDGDDIGH